MSEKVAIGSDHRGFALKEFLKGELDRLGKAVDDKGAHSTDSVDYPEFAAKVAGAVSDGSCDRGILICGSGIGMSVAANKFAGVRAALCQNAHMAKMSRLHNNANVLVMGESVEQGAAREMVQVWFQTAFEGGRHQKRLDLITAIEKDQCK